MRNYPRLDIYEFGEHLLTSGDLDPVYIALNQAEWETEAHLYRWLVAYWAFYHCGAASALSEHEGEAFWDAMMVAAVNEQPTPLGGRWPRGSERRHFRGQQAIAAIRDWRLAYGDRPEDMVSWIAGGPSSPSRAAFAEVAARARKHRAFGPWIAFKICDMLDRLGIAPIDFDRAAVFMFDDPAKAALMLWRQLEGLPDNATPKNAQVRTEVIDAVVEHLTAHFAGHTAPPIHERPVGLQEIETILCCWKSHLNGHYPLYNDMTEINAGRRPWSEISETARRMLEAMPKEPGYGTA